EGHTIAHYPASAKAPRESLEPPSAPAQFPGQILRANHFWDGYAHLCSLPEGAGSGAPTRLRYGSGNEVQSKSSLKSPQSWSIRVRTWPAVNSNELPSIPSIAYRVLPATGALLVHSPTRLLSDRHQSHPAQHGPRW